MVRAMNKRGLIAEFSDLAWKMMSKKNSGWVLFDGTIQEIPIPKEVKEFQATVTAKKNVVAEAEKKPKPTKRKAK